MATLVIFDFTFLAYLLIKAANLSLLVFGNFFRIIKEIIFNRAFSLGIHEIMDIYLPTVDIF